jgi:hypothetical protein
MDGFPVVEAAAGPSASLAVLGVARVARPLNRVTVAAGAAVAALSATTPEAAGALLPLHTLVAVRKMGRRTPVLVDGLALAVGLVAGIVAAIPLVFAIAGW